MSVIDERAEMESVRVRAVCLLAMGMILTPKKPPFDLLWSGAAVDTMRKQAVVPVGH